MADEELLTDADKARIRAEEEYRAQVRSEAQSSPLPPKPSKPTPTIKQQLQQGLILLLVIVFAGVGFTWYFMSSGSRGLTGVVNAASGTYRYEVTSTCPVDLTYSEGSGTTQKLDTPTPWSLNVQGVTTPQVIAQLKCEGGTVTAKILNGSAEVKSVTSSGDYAIAHAH